eukprot:EG_transcript_4235
MDARQDLAAAIVAKMEDKNFNPGHGSQPTCRVYDAFRNDERWVQHWRRVCRQCHITDLRTFTDFMRHAPQGEFCVVGGGHPRSRERVHLERHRDWVLADAVCRIKRRQHETQVLQFIRGFIESQPQQWCTVEEVCRGFPAFAACANGIPREILAGDVVRIVKRDPQLLYDKRTNQIHKRS